MPSGANTCSRTYSEKETPSGFSSSTSRPTTAIPTLLYWYAAPTGPAQNGVSAPPYASDRPAANTRRKCSSSGGGGTRSKLPRLMPSPLRWVSRSRSVIGRGPCGLTIGRCLSIGSSSPIRPRSTSCRTATPVYALASDPVGPIVSVVMGRPVARSACPYALVSTTSVPTPTAIESPGVPQ